MRALSYTLLQFCCCLILFRFCCCVLICFCRLQTSLLCFVTGLWLVRIRGFLPRLVYACDRSSPLGHWFLESEGFCRDWFTLVTVVVHWVAVGLQTSLLCFVTGLWFLRIRGFLPRLVCACDRSSPLGRWFLESEGFCRDWFTLVTVVVHWVAVVVTETGIFSHRFNQSQRLGKFHKRDPTLNPNPNRKPGWLGRCCGHRNRDLLPSLQPEPAFGQISQTWSHTQP